MKLKKMGVSPPRYIPICVKASKDATVHSEALSMMAFSVFSSLPLKLGGAKKELKFIRG
jgi:hypothetical protein